MKKLFFSALVLGGTLAHATSRENLAATETTSTSSEVLKTGKLSAINEHLPWYTETTITTYWVAGYPVLVITKTRIVWYN